MVKSALAATWLIVLTGALCPAQDSCIQRLQIPSYPPAARNAGVEGTVTASLLLTLVGSVDTLATEVHSSYADARRYFAPAVEAAVRGALFQRACGMQTVSLTFHFQLNRDRVSSSPRQGLPSGTPNQFWISTTMPLSQRPGKTMDVPQNFDVISGDVFDPSGAPLSLAVITLSGSGGAAISPVRVTERGRFTLPPVPAGTYQLRIAQTGFVSFQRTIEVSGGEGTDISPIVLPVADMHEGGIEATVPPCCKRN